MQDCGFLQPGAGTGAGARGELQHYGYEGRRAEDAATVGAKDAEDDIVPSDAQFQAGWGEGSGKGSRRQIMVIS